MRRVYTFVISFLFIAFAFAQTAEELRLEAYPDEPVINHFTNFELLWQNMIQAKKNGDSREYSFFSEKLRKDFPEKFVGSQIPSPVDIPTQDEINSLAVSFMTEAEMQLFTGTLITYGTATQSGGNPRTVRLRSAPDGTQYLSFGPSTNDTFYIFRSTNAGSSWSLFTFGSTPNSTGKGLDFYITDTTGSYRLGLILSTQTQTENGVLTFITYSPAQSTPLMMNTFALPDPGRGLINPVIVSDGYYYDPSLTYWYIAYQDYSASTPSANPIRAALTADWGQTWTFTTARSGFNDYDVAIEFHSYSAADTVFVLLSNNLTLTNANLRLRKVAVSNFVGAFSQFNPASTAEPEFYGNLKVDRVTGRMICTFTRTQGGVNNAAYVYSEPGGPYFTANTPTFIAQNPNNEYGIDVACVEGQSIFRLVYISSGGSKDTIIYKWSTDLSTGFQGHVVINEVNNSSGEIFPSITGYISNILAGNNDGSGIAFGGAGNSGLFYNNYSDTGIPVELNSFTASVQGQSVNLFWQTATETNNRGFEIQRTSILNSNKLNWEMIGFVEGNGTTTSLHEYVFTDKGLTPGSYSYRLKQIDLNGDYEFSNEIEVRIISPQEYVLAQNYPNPFNPSTIISYNLPAVSSVRLELFSVTGENLATLVNAEQETGYYSVEVNSESINLAAGAYFYRLTAIDNSSGKMFVETKKLLLLK